MIRYLAGRVGTIRSDALVLWRRARRSRAFVSAGKERASAVPA
jgi:hypothetical protein